MRLVVQSLAAACLMLSGCDEKPADALETATKHGRYAGIGTFEAGPLWQKMAGVPQAKDPARANIADDAHVIVVVDTRTGEVRQCGDLSGYCLAMNPWKATPGALPVRLTEHASDGAVEAEPSEAASAKDKTVDSK